MTDTTMVAACEACPLGVAQAVASRGPVPARLLFLSGAPRYHEEHEGSAFASPAFEALEAALTDVGLDSGDVHYATLTGCRPPYQRPVRAAEIAACAPRLELTIEAVVPEVVVLCGPDAVAAMLTMVTLSVGHGTLYRQGRRYYYPIRHPYAALHYQGYENEVKDDLRKLAALLAGGDLDAHAIVSHDAQATAVHHTPATAPNSETDDSPALDSEVSGLAPSGPPHELVSAPSADPAPATVHVAANVSSDQPALHSTAVSAGTLTAADESSPEEAVAPIMPDDDGEDGAQGAEDETNADGEADAESNPTQLSLF